MRWDRKKVRSTALEGDNLAQENATNPRSERLAENFRRWLTACQEGVKRACDTIESDITVLHAPEMNYPLDAKNAGTARVINEVIPDVGIDLVSYSAWEFGDQLAGYRWPPDTTASDSSTTPSR